MFDMYYVFGDTCLQACIEQLVKHASQMHYIGLRISKLDCTEEYSCQNLIFGVETQVYLVTHIC